MTRREFRLASLLFSVSVFGSGLETIRHRPAPTPVVDRTRPDSIWVADSMLGYRNRSNYEWRLRSLYRSMARFGGFGRRLNEREPVDISRVNLACVGDSMTVCIEVDEAETPASRLEALVPCRAVNLGVRGYSTIQSRILLREWLPRLPSLRVVLYHATSGDLVENIDPGVLVGRLPAPSGRIVDGRVVVVPQVEALADRPHMGDREAIERGCREGGPLLALILREWRDELAARGVTLVTSWAGGVGSREVETAVREAGVAFVDVSSAFDRPAHDYETMLLTGVHDSHWNALGCETFARAVEPEILTRLRGQR